MKLFNAFVADVRDAGRYFGHLAYSYRVAAERERRESACPDCGQKQGYNSECEGACEDSREAMRDRW